MLNHGVVQAARARRKELGPLDALLQEFGLSNQEGVALMCIAECLLRIADPHNHTTAAQAFAARSIVISPLLGGGLITATMPLLVVRFGVVPMLVASAVVTLAAWLWPTRDLAR